jgi:hypothetical protein
MSTYQPVPFNEGAPLDPSLLMRLQSNVTEAYTKAIAISNATKTTEYTVKSDCNKVTVTGLAGNKHGTVKVSVPGFTSKAIVVATPAQTNTRAKEQITIHITEMKDGEFTINAVSSNSERKELSVNWHISERQI